MILMKNVVTKTSLIVLFCSSTTFFCSDNPNRFTTFLQSEQVQKVKELTCSVAKKGYETTAWAATSTIQYVRNKSQVSANQSDDKNSIACQGYQSHSDSDSDSEFSTIKISSNNFFRDQQELQASLETDTPKTIRKLNTFTVDCFTKENPEKLSTQKDMLHTFALLQESCNQSKQLALDPAIANDYNAQQRALLINKIEEHAHTVEPEFEIVYQAAKTIADNDYNRRVAAAKKKHEDAIKKADDTRLNSLNKSKNTLYTFAFNSQYLNHRATKKEDLVAHNLENFASEPSYKFFLEDARKQQIPMSSTQETTSQIEPLEKNSKNNSANGKSKNKKIKTDENA